MDEKTCWTRRRIVFAWTPLMAFSGRYPGLLRVRLLTDLSDQGRVILIDLPGK